jgi:hypothetical protein
MFRVVFTDSVLGEEQHDFETFADASEYWEQYADTPTCVEGELIDLTNGETIWAFCDGSQNN